MNSIYDAAHQLAHAIRASKEFRDFMAAKEAIMHSDVDHKMIAEFHAKQLEFQHSQLIHGEGDVETMEELERLYSLLSINPTAREYLEQEFKISCLFNDIHTILNEAMKEVLPIGFEENFQNGAK